jgi:hypothetical protein
MARSGGRFREDIQGFAADEVELAVFHGAADLTNTRGRTLVLAG